ncbi:MAG: class II aldolase/adducin family protein, partial [Alphaproteobacteria bacterium]
MNEGLRELRVDLAAAYRLAVVHGFHEGICNHLTAALPGAPDRFLVIPYGLHWSEVTASTLIVVDGRGTTIEGGGRVEPTALHIHGPVHRSRPDAACVLHSHMPYATALASLADPRLVMATQNAFGFHGRVAYDEDYAGIALDDAEGERLAARLDGKDVLLMANHGVLVVGPTVADAY